MPVGSFRGAPTPAEGGGGDDPRREGTGTLGSNAANAISLFGNPVLAAFLGAVVGVGSLLFARAASRLVTPQDPHLGFAKVALVSLGRMLAIIAALAAYFVLARPGFPAFAVSLIVGFMGTLGFEAFRVSSRTRRPARTGQGGRTTRVSTRSGGS